MTQRRFLTEFEIHKVVALLTNTDLSIAQIAVPMQCSRSAVNSINRRFRVRDYEGNRNKWVWMKDKTA